MCNLNQLTSNDILYDLVVFAYSFKYRDNLQDFTLENNGKMRKEKKNNTIKNCIKIKWSDFV